MGIYSYTLKQDQDDRIIKKTETIKSTSVTWTYSYDSAGRLQEAKLDGRLVCQCSYDKQGRRSQDYLPITVGKQMRNYRYTMDNRLQQAGNNGYTHDKQGFRTLWNNRGKYTRYEYAPDYRLLRADKEDEDRVYEFTHAPNGQRATKQCNGTMVEAYLWLDFMRLAAFYDGDHIYAFAYHANERTPFALQRDDGAVGFLFYDQVGSLRVVADTSGNVIKEILYDPFGGIMEDTNPSLHIPIGFAGGLHDRDLGFIHFGWRDYDTFTSRWTTPDPMGDAGGDDDWYGYCLDDPVNMIDPLGLWDVSDIGSDNTTTSVSDVDSDNTTTSVSDIGDRDTSGSNGNDSSLTITVSDLDQTEETLSDNKLTSATQNVVAMKEKLKELEERKGPPVKDKDPRPHVVRAEAKPNILGRPTSKPNHAKDVRSLKDAEVKAGLREPTENKEDTTSSDIESNKGPENGLLGNTTKKTTPKTNGPSIAGKVASQPSIDLSKEINSPQPGSTSTPSLGDVIRSIGKVIGAGAPTPTDNEGDNTNSSVGIEKKSDKVNDANLSEKITRQYRTIKSVYEKYGQKAVVTSANDSKHKNNSKHYSDEAIDLRGNTMSERTMKAIAAELQQKLGENYDVLSEVYSDPTNNHIHIEYDPN